MEKEKLTLRLTETEMKKLKIIASKRGYSVSELVREWIGNFVEEKERENFFSRHE